MSFTLCMAKARSQEKGGQSRRLSSEKPSIAGVVAMSSAAARSQHGPTPTHRFHPAQAGTKPSPPTAPSSVMAGRRPGHPAGGCVAPCAKPHQFDSRSPQHSQASHPDFEPTYARYFRPGVYSSSLRPHRATRDERARARGRVVRGSPRTRRDRADRAGSFLRPGSGADGHHDRCPSRSRWADRRLIPSRPAPRQHSRQPPLPSDRPSARIARRDQRSLTSPD